MSGVLYTLTRMGNVEHNNPDSLNNPDPSYTLGARCKSSWEASVYKSELEKLGVIVETSKEDPNVILITVGTPEEAGRELILKMNPIRDVLDERYQRKLAQLAQEEEAQKPTVLPSPVISQIPESVVTAPPVEKSTILRLLDHFANLFGTPAKPLRQSGQSF